MTTYDWPTTRATTIYNFGGDAPRNDLEQRIMDIFAQQPQLVIKAIGVVTTNYEAGKIRSPWAILDLNLKEAVRPGTPLTATDTSEKQKRIARAEAWIRTTGAHYDRDTEILEELFGDRGLLRDYAQIDVEPYDGGTDERTSSPNHDQSGTNRGAGRGLDSRSASAELHGPTGNARSGDSDHKGSRHQLGDELNAPPPRWQLAEPTGDTALVERMTKLWNDARPAGIAIEEDAEQRAAKFLEQQAELRTLKAQIAAARTPETRKPLPEPDYSADPQTDPAPV